MNTHSNHDHGAASSGGSKTPATTVGTVVDPVCGMSVDPATTVHHATHQGTDYHFCSSKCRERFIAEPQKYLSPEPKTAEIAAPAGTIYTCPMHPQIRQEGPGTCPICGMALEPEMPSLDEEDNPELRDFTRRFWWTLPLTIIVLTLAMVGHVPHLRHGVGAGNAES